MLAVIARESTEGFSGLRTSPMLRPIWEKLFGIETDAHWAVIHHLLRKCGHFAGYGTLGLTWLRAWLLQWMEPLRMRQSIIWRGWSFAMALWCTALIASLDELHQTFLPDRTGVVQDVVLDTMGALALCTATALFWRRGRRAQAQIGVDAASLP